ncbi:glycine betaine ABC transporter substrate-binding protein [Marinilabiliaceae bacterium ANBcel2]|nr:glycine betaine ABC transporter substrate-binding protein [Marinilabiliaceae bacterium ANBcel2]
MKITKKLFSKLTLLLLTAAVAFQFHSCAEAESETIELGYVLWDSEVASTHVVAAILEDRLEKDVNMTAVDAGPMWMGISRGNFDAIVAAWLPATHGNYLEETQDRIVNLGPNLEGARIGLVVPSYVDINSIEELNDNADKFDNEIVGIDPGAGIMGAAENALEVYDLDLQLLSGSDAAMAAALRRAYEREEWVVVTGWTPHWKFAAYDLKYLEDPKKSFGDAEHIATIVTPELQQKDPEVYAFLDNFFWEAEDMAEVMMMIEEGAEPFDAAREWIANNPAKVESWLP